MILIFLHLQTVFVLFKRTRTIPKNVAIDYATDRTYDVTHTGVVIKFTFPRIAKKRTTASIQRVTMPPKSKKKRQSIEAAARGREILKKARLGQDSSETAVSPSDTYGPAQRDIPQPREEAGQSGLQSGEDVSDVSPLEVLEEYVESWVQSLDHEDRKSVSMLLCLVLVKELSFTETRAAELAANVLKKNDKTVHRWRTDLIANGGFFAESKDSTKGPECCGQTKSLPRELLST